MNRDEYRAALERFGLLLRDTDFTGVPAVEIAHLVSTLEYIHRRYPEVRNDYQPGPLHLVERP